MSARPKPTEEYDFFIEDYDIDKDLPWIREARERIQRDIEGMTSAEITQYFDESEARLRAKVAQRKQEQGQ